MSFINGKVALVTGGASGIGFCYVRELLKNGLRGVTIADIDSKKGDDAVNVIAQEFGKNRAVFIKTDVSKEFEVEAAFKKTIEVFKNLDIVVNNAGILNDAIWEKQIAININGTVYGCVLGMDQYLPKYKTGSEGVIVNIASIAGLTYFDCIPVYVATKHAIVGLSKSFGRPSHYDRTKVRVVTICPGVTNTPLISDANNRNLGPAYEKLLPVDFGRWSFQEPEFVAKGLVKAVEEGETGSFWLVDNSVIEKIEIPDILKSHKKYL